MRSFCFRKSLKRFGVRVAATLLLVVSIVVQLPLPIPSIGPNIKKDSSRPFPCQNRPCGCRTAEQCKKKCCCFSAGQKLAWAERHGVDPSEVVDVSLTPERRNITPRKACCTTRNVANGENVRAASQSKTPSSSRQDPASSRQKQVRIVIGMMAQDCQGVMQTVFGQPVFLIPPPLSLVWIFEPTGERFVARQTRWTQPDADPPVPPPRLVAV